MLFLCLCSILPENANLLRIMRECRRGSGVYIFRTGTLDENRALFLRRGTE